MLKSAFWMIFSPKNNFFSKTDDKNVSVPAQRKNSIWFQGVPGHPGPEARPPAQNQLLTQWSAQGMMESGLQIPIQIYFFRQQTSKNIKIAENREQNWAVFSIEFTSRQNSQTKKEQTKAEKNHDLFKMKEEVETQTKRPEKAACAPATRPLPWSSPRRSGHATRTCWPVPSQ